MKACIDKACRRAGQLLRSTEFYVKSDSRDQRDVYCKECRLRRVRAAHAKAKECERNQRLANPGRKPIVITKVTDPFSMVYQAISKGLKTREEIRKATRVDYDTMGDILTELVWGCKVVKIENNQFVMVEDKAA